MQYILYPTSAHGMHIYSKQAYYHSLLLFETIFF